MAVETGTASSAEDLYNKLISFLTTNADLVSAGQAWSVAWNDPIPLENQSDIVLRGPGLSGQDQVYVGMRLYQDVIGDRYFIQTVGMTGVLPNGQSYVDHINATPSYVRTFLDLGTMTYWFVANGRRFVVVIKISTSFEALYAGLFLPYATPLAYPYPLFIGGSAGPISNNGPFNWRSEHTNHSHFVEPNYNISSNANVESGAWMMSPQADWRRVAVVNAAPVGIHPVHTNGDFFYTQTNQDSYQANFVRGRMMDAYGGDRMLIPCTLTQHEPTSQTYGILDNVHRCQGVANAAENLITADGVDHMVVQNVYRSDFQDYWTIGLE